MANKIIQVFPKETLDTFFIAPIKTKYSISGKSMGSKGKIKIKYSNLCQYKRKSDESEAAALNANTIRPARLIEISPDVQTSIKDKMILIKFKII